MGHNATTVTEQINQLQSRGMTITNVEKAKEVLLDVGYYRLGFYWFPFEKPTKRGERRQHTFLPCANFDDAVKLYYFDYAMRNLIQKYLTRIEVNFRTLLIYTVSNKYPLYPTWFVSPKVVERKYINKFDTEVNTSKFKRNKFIARHHKMHINDKYAPAWKTLEFMTLGNNIILFKSLSDIEIKKQISQHFGIKYTNVFENYMDVLLCLRNTCAHGGLLYDIALYPLIRRGPAGVVGNESSTLRGAIKVVRYMLSCVSENRANDFDKELQQIFSKYITTTELKSVLRKMSGYTEL